MLERFKVLPKDIVRVPDTSLHKTTAAIFEKMGCSPSDAKEGADTLVTTDLRGVESHGVSNQLRVYVKQYMDGELNPRPKIKTIKEFPGSASLDGDRGLGIILGPRCMKMAIEKAKKVGVGVVTMRNSGHVGAVGHHSMIAAKADMVGMCVTSGGQHVLPTFGGEPRLGTNPISIAAPARKEPFLLYDAATAAIAGNKIFLAERVGATLLPGWIAQKDGTPVMEEKLSPGRDHYYQLPLGGTREQGSHKGYGLGLMVEVLATMLAGASPAMLGEPRLAQDHFFAAFNIAAFTDLDEFKDRMDAMLNKLKTTKPAAGQKRVLYPGLPEFEDEQDRKKNGIPLHKEVVQWFDSITGELNIPKLERMKK
ncbi:MAG: Ldh family oxidoreductase [SAR202 cluster bacterium]|nr:Ldh family oxidoreductase [SAR202 cluster bacterium]